MRILDLFFIAFVVDTNRSYRRREQARRALRGAPRVACFDGVANLKSFGLAQAIPTLQYVCSIVAAAVLT